MKILKLMDCDMFDQFMKLTFHLSHYNFLNHFNDLFDLQ